MTRGGSSSCSHAIMAERFWTPLRLRALRHGLWVGAALAMIVTAAVVTGSRVGVDAHAYWAAWQHKGLYAIQPEHVDAYEYSPAFAQGVWPLAQLPWPAFCVLWLAAVLAAYLWLLAPLELRWRLPLLVLCSPDIATGNVWSLFAIVLVLGLRWPALWAFPLLTKVTPVVGPVWFATRHEWRPLAIALGTTAGITAVSFAAAPHLWGDWVRYVLHPDRAASASTAQLLPLLHPPTALFVALAMPCSIVLTFVAAKRDRPWLLPIAMVAAMPFFTANAFAMLTAIPRLRRASTSLRPRPEDHYPVRVIEQDARPGLGAEAVSGLL